MFDIRISGVHDHIAILRRIRNSLVSPLCRMPYEIIVKMISFVPNPDEEDEHVSVLLAKMGPICHYVWSILKDTQKFWGHVDFNHHDSVISLLRCRGRPTRVWVRYGPSEARNSWTNTTLHNWHLSSTRSVESLEEFRFFGTSGDFDGYKWIFADPLPRLHTLTVVSGRIQYSWVPETIETWSLSGRFLAGLRSITLKQVLIPWETCLTSHLVDLNLDYSQTTEGVPITMSTFVELLSLCTSLETLRLCCAGPDTQDEGVAHVPSNNPAHLISLRLFEIFDDALNIAYIMNNLKLPDTASIHIEPSIDWPEQLVNSALPRATRIAPTEGLIRWDAGQESTVSMGNTEFTYQMDIDDEDFMQAFRATFNNPFVQLTQLSTSAITTLELDFDLEFEPGQAVWFAVLAALPALKRLSCTSRGPMSHYFAPKFFSELGVATAGGVHCPQLQELDLSKFDFSDMRLVYWVLRALDERHKAGFPVEKIFRNKTCDVVNLPAFQRRVAEVGLIRALSEEPSV